MQLSKVAFSLNINTYFLWWRLLAGGTIPEEIRGKSFCYFKVEQRARKAAEKSAVGAGGEAARGECKRICGPIVLMVSSKDIHSIVFSFLPTFFSFVKNVHSLKKNKTLWNCIKGKTDSSSPSPFCWTAMTLVNVFYFSVTRFISLSIKQR